MLVKGTDADTMGCERLCWVTVLWGLELMSSDVLGLVFSS